ncbi:MAG: RDD family protein [Steroidobacteraceae bacterium]
MDREPLHSAGLTGVDTALDIAGAGTRSYAFLLDWHIRVLLALGWYCLVWMLVVGVGAVTLLGPRPHWFLAVAALPAILIYVFYHPVLEVLMHGRTPGKRRAGVRIVLRNGATPGTGALLVRNVFRLLDSLPMFYVVGLACCLTTEQRVRIGDLAAGTVLIRDSATAARALAQLGSKVAQSGLKPEVVELVHDVLERWSELELSRRDEIARSILARIDHGGSSVPLAALDDAQLRSRLRALVNAGADRRS